MIGIGYGAKNAITLDANACVTGSFMALMSVVTGSATVVTSTTVGPYVALNADGHQEVPITQLTDVVWGDNRNVTDNPSGDHHFTSHSIGAINLPAGATLQGPIYSFKVVAGSVIGYLSERNYGFQTCPE